MAVISEGHGLTAGSGYLRQTGQLIISIAVFSGVGKLFLGQIAVKVIAHGCGAADRVGFSHHIVSRVIGVGIGCTVGSLQGSEITHAVIGILGHIAKRILSLDKLTVGIIEIFLHAFISIRAGNHTVKSVIAEFRFVAVLILL